MNRAMSLGMALLAGLGGSAHAMTGQAAAIPCSIEQAAKLPAGLSGESVCAALGAAAAPAVAGAGLKPADVSLRVTVESRTKLTGAATLKGRVLPEHHVAIADRELNARAVAMLANAIAAEIASGRQ